MFFHAMCLVAISLPCPALPSSLLQVRLLLGEVPDRPEFAVPGLATPLRPYFEITQAVRSGDLVKFGEVSEWDQGVRSSDKQHNPVVLWPGCHVI
jgi:hypothetical protein